MLCPRGPAASLKWKPCRKSGLVCRSLGMYHALPYFAGAFGMWIMMFIVIATRSRVDPWQIIAFFFAIGTATFFCGVLRAGCYSIVTIYPSDGKYTWRRRIYWLPTPRIAGGTRDLFWHEAALDFGRFSATRSGIVLSNGRSAIVLHAGVRPEGKRLEESRDRLKSMGIAKGESCRVVVLQSLLGVAMG